MFGHFSTLWNKSLKMTKKNQNFSEKHATWIRDILRGLLINWRYFTRLLICLKFQEVITLNVKITSIASFKVSVISEWSKQKWFSVIIYLKMEYLYLSGCHRWRFKRKLKTLQSSGFLKKGYVCAKAFTHRNLRCISQIPQWLT